MRKVGSSVVSPLSGRYVSTGVQCMSDFIGGVIGIALYTLPGICYLHGIYLGFQESFLSFALAVLIIPWGIIKGFIGFF